MTYPPQYKQHVLLNNEAMEQLDRDTISCGTLGIQLMEQAGSSAVEQICHHYSPIPTLVLCGPGNNGGDGFVIARLLAQQGFNVQVAQALPKGHYQNDAAIMEQKYIGEAIALEECCKVIDDQQYQLVIDALFGTGLNRPIEGIYHTVLQKVSTLKAPIVAIDIPSGINGNTGQVQGIAAPAMLTVTFAFKKLGHTLIPGRDYCGKIIVTDIGHPPNLLQDIRSDYIENHPELWQKYLPSPSNQSHKYNRGYTLIYGGPIACTGASRMASYAALRAGAGICSIACTPAALPIYAASVTAIMTKSYSSDAELNKMLDSNKLNALLIGPGAGVNDTTRRHTLMMLNTQLPCVLDADALTCFSDNPQILFNAIKQRNAATILTPHSGEFDRIFGITTPEKRIESVMKAAMNSGAIIILKGADSIIGTPDGNVTINTHASFHLATAGAGDVLAGIIAGLLATNMPPYKAVQAAIWIHGECGIRCGKGLIAEDLIDVLPNILHSLTT